MDYEFNRRPFGLPASGSVTLARTAGDVLITFDFSSGANIINLGLMRWLTAASGDRANQCFKNNALPCWGRRVTITATSTSQIAQAIVSSDLLRGEAVIDISAAGLVLPQECNAFAQVWLKSRSSDSFTAELKDLIAPVPFNFNPCVSVQALKFNDANGNGVQDSGESALAGWTFFIDANGNGVRDAGELSAATDASGTVTFANLPPAQYTVCEEVQTGWRVTTNQCQTVDATTTNSVASVAFGNQELYKAIVITCRERDNAVINSAVTMAGGSQSTVTGSVSGSLVAQLCSSTGTSGDIAGSAEFYDLTDTTYTANIEINA